jgi:hypothetical protein
MGLLCNKKAAVTVVTTALRKPCFPTRFPFSRYSIPITIWYIIIVAMIRVRKTLSCRLFHRAV